MFFLSVWEYMWYVYYNFKKKFEYQRACHEGVTKALINVFGASIILQI